MVCGVAIPAQGEGEGTGPERLLPKALELARTLPDGKGYGNWAKPLVVLRMASTMRLAGMNDKAMAAFEECAAMNARLGEEAIRDEIGIELCRAFTQLGKTETARELAKELKFRNYSTVALYVTARTALEMNRPAEVEEVIRSAVLDRSSQTETNRGDDLWAHACVNQIQMRKHHPIALGLPPVIVIPRRNGGMLVPRPGCEVAGWYDTIERYAALVAGGYGLGRVVAFSPHPEGSSGFIPRDRLCINATYWANGGSP